MSKTYTEKELQDLLEKSGNQINVAELDRNKIYVFRIRRDGMSKDTASNMAKIIKDMLDKCYKKKITDEFIPPLLTLNYRKIKDGDVVIWMNYRNDRSRQIMEALTNPNYSEFKTNNLENAKVVSIHYSKNFDLENTTAICLTQIIEKLDISKRLDIAKTDYRNGGQIIRFHTNSYEVAFYDKVADLKQSIISEKRALENYNLIQQDLLSSLIFHC